MKLITIGKNFDDKSCLRMLALVNIIIVKFLCKLLAQIDGSIERSFFKVDAVLYILKWKVEVKIFIARFFHTEGV